MKYFVHIYAVCRRRVEVEAANQEEAVLKANAMDMSTLFDTRIGDTSEIEFADEVMDFLVDEDGDSEYSKSQLWELDGDDKPRRRFRIGIRG